MTSKAAKGADQLNPDCRVRLRRLMADLAASGPMQPTWRNYGPLKGQKAHYHCHIKSGQPTMVVCWRVTDKQVQIIEVYYVGTHASTPY